MHPVRATILVFLFFNLTLLMEAREEKILADYIALHYELEDGLLNNETLLHAHVEHVVAELVPGDKLVTAGRYAERYKDLFALLKDISLSELVDFVTSDPVYLSGGMITWTHTPYGVIYPPGGPPAPPDTEVPQESTAAV